MCVSEGWNYRRGNRFSIGYGAEEKRKSSPSSHHRLEVVDVWRGQGGMSIVGGNVLKGSLGHRHF